MRRLRGWSDAELLAGTPRDRDAFAEFYRRHERSVLGFFVHWTRSAELSADLMAETFAAAFESAGRYQPERGEPSAWLFGIAHNMLARKARVQLDHLRGMTSVQVAAATLRAIERGKHELEVLGLVDAADVEAGYVVRMPKAYPMYDATFKANVETLRTWLAEHATNFYPVGRNGMHRYNNQDHSMYTAMLSVENIFGAHHDVWTVNVEADYHEERDDT